MWRADLLESVDNPGSFDRARHRPRFDGWEPGRRKFEKALSADPVGWVGSRLADLAGLLSDAGFGADDVGPTDAADVKAAVPEITDVTQRLLDRVRRR